MAPAYTLSQDQIARYHADGYLKLDDVLTRDEVAKLVSTVRAIEEWPESPGKWMKYYEKNPTTQALQLCRTENFTPYSEFLRDIVSGARIMGILEQLNGEPYVLFKEKINAKLPGGQGFAPHQDAPAFTHMGPLRHLTVLFTVDDSTVDNGCLFAVPGSHKGNKVLPQEEDGTISREWCDAKEWLPVECKSGDILVFGSYLAHVSGVNKTETSRANLYMTYNPRSEGDKRDHYYADKRAKFPPLSERVPGTDYSQNAKIYNLANPIL